MDCLRAALPRVRTHRSLIALHNGERSTPSESASLGRATVATRLSQVSPWIRGCTAAPYRWPAFPI